MKKTYKVVICTEDNAKNKPLWVALGKAISQGESQVEFEYNEKFDLHSLGLEDSGYIEIEDSRNLLPSFQVLSTSVRLTGVFDFVINELGKNIPRLIFAEALKTTLVKKAKALDISHPALIVGDDGRVRAVIATMSSLGFKEIYLVGPEDVLQEHVEFVQRNFMGMSFKIVQSSELTSAQIAASLIVNLQSISEESSLHTDLAYFNYLKSDGWVVDLSGFEKNSYLYDEALRADLPAISGDEFCEYYAQSINREIVNKT